MTTSVLLTSLILSYTPIVVHSHGLELIDPTVKEATASTQNASLMPVRISRTFFESNLKGSISASATNDSQSYFENESLIQWVQQPPSAPAPGPGALADYRDFTACAQYSSLSSVGLCFNVMPDVSSVSVTDPNTQLVGLNDYVSQQLTNSGRFSDCAYKVENLQIEKVERTSDYATMNYLAKATPTAGCQGPDQMIRVRLHLEKT